MTSHSSAPCNPFPCLDWSIILMRKYLSLGAAPAPPASQVTSGLKRSAPAEAGSTKKSSRKSLGPVNGTNGSATVNGTGRKLTRRSIAAIPSTEEVRTPARTPARTPGRSRKSDLSSVSEVSQSVTTCLGPDKDQAESLAVLREEEEEEEEEEEGLANPTPMMKEVMKKRKSIAPSLKTSTTATSSKAKTQTKILTKSPAKILTKTPAKTKAREPSPPPRPDFPCQDNAKVGREQYFASNY